MQGVEEAARKGLDASLAAVRHAAWWLRWQTDRHACREVADLQLLAPRPANVQRPVA
jgi:hypothetical protein